MSLKRNAGCTASAILLGSTLFTASSAIAQEFSSDNLSPNYPYVVMSTSMGDMLIELDQERAPQSVNNFLQYVEDDFYDGTIFHRVIDGFMVQGGGFTADFKLKTTRSPVSNEAYNGLRNSRYTIAMARTNAAHSATSQFFINTADNTNLDHQDTTQRGWGYTVFGKVVQGQHVVDSISVSRTSSGGVFSRDVPVTAVVIDDVYRFSFTPSNAVPNPADNTDQEPSAAAANPAKDLLQNAQPDAIKTGLEPKQNVFSSFIKLLNQN